MEPQQAIWNAAAECMPREELQQLQLQRLQQTLRRVVGPFDDRPYLRFERHEVTTRGGDVSENVVDLR